MAGPVGTLVPRTDFVLSFPFPRICPSDPPELALDKIVSYSNFVLGYSLLLS